MKTQKEVIVNMERDDTEILQIDFPGADCFYIHWADGTTTKYRYNFVKISTTKTNGNTNKIILEAN